MKHNSIVRTARRRIARLPGVAPLYNGARKLVFEAELAGLRLEQRLRPPRPSGLAERLTVIIPSFDRPQNIQLIANSLLRCDFVERVVVTNNNPDVPLERYLELDDPRFTLVTQPERCRPIKKMELAREIEADYFSVIDDDVFLRAGQCEALFRHLLANPAVPIGAIGQVYDPTRRTGSRSNLVSGRRSPVDVLNRLYFFTAEHRERFFVLLAALYARSPERSPLRFGDDIVLSFSGRGRPMVYDVGRFINCPSGDDPAVALWRRRGFKEYRWGVYQDLLALTDGRMRFLAD